MIQKKHVYQTYDIQRGLRIQFVNFSLFKEIVNGP